MDEHELQYFAEQVRTARAILLTGAGFSLRAKNVTGQSIPSVSALTGELWHIAFPGRDYDGSSLGDVFEAGLLQRRTEVERVMRERLSVD